MASKLGRERVRVRGSGGTGSVASHITYCSLRKRKQESSGGKMELIHSGGCCSS